MSACGQRVIPRPQSGHDLLWVDLKGGMGNEK